MLNIIGGIDHPTKGQVIVAGQELNDKDEDFLSEFRCAHVGFVFQAYNLVSTLTVAENVAFLSASWQTIMLLPLATLVSASICLVAYMMLSVDEQHQEFAILRAIGAKPRIIVSISAIQSAVVLLSSFGIGLSFGTIFTFMILMANPSVTPITILTISGWIITALIALFILSLYPAFKLSKTSILKILT
ncbi:MAG: hypothetical protein M1540_00430 [Candidatus Bathyarchaeota archaeon]|nr:hypothetical protein [Candidatus Bathyarchaeota archaeon]